MSHKFEFKYRMEANRYVELDPLKALSGMFALHKARFNNQPTILVVNSLYWTVIEAELEKNSGKKVGNEVWGMKVIVVSTPEALAVY